MRSNYILYSKENINELLELQETLISLIGYDSNQFDNYIEINGEINDLIDTIDTNITELMNNRLYGSSPIYSTLYKKNLISIIRRD